MKLGHVIVYVKDVAKTVAFYEKAFGLKQSFIDETGMYAQMETGDTALGFAHDQLAKQNLGIEYHKNSSTEMPSGFEISLTASDVSKAFRMALENGCTKVADPQHKPWGQEVGYVRDLNGTLVEISSEMKM